MAVQLSLLDAPKAWQLSASTRAVGRRGVAEARAALEAARERTQPADRAGHPSHRTAA